MYNTVMYLKVLPVYLPSTTCTYIKAVSFCCVGTLECELESEQLLSVCDLCGRGQSIWFSSCFLFELRPLLPSISSFFFVFAYALSTASAWANEHRLFPSASGVSPRRVTHGARLGGGYGMVYCCRSCVVFVSVFLLSLFLLSLVLVLVLGSVFYCHCLCLL